MGPMTLDSSTQRIGRLTPLSVVLALIETRVGAAAQTKTPLTAARGLTFADDVVGSARPPHAMALRDGYRSRQRTRRRCRLLYAHSVAADDPPHRCRRTVAERHRRGAAAGCRGAARPSRRGDCSRRRRRGRAGGRRRTSRRTTPLRRAGERVRAIDLAVMSGRRHRGSEPSPAANPRRVGRRCQVGADRGGAGNACAPCRRSRRRRHRQRAPARAGARRFRDRRGDRGRRHRQRPAGRGGPNFGAAWRRRGAWHCHIARRDRRIRICRARGRCCWSRGGSMRRWRSGF